MKFRILLSFFLIFTGIGLLCACSGTQTDDPSGTLPADETTESEDKPAEDPVLALANLLKDYSIVNNTDINKADYSVFEALYTSKYRLRPKLYAKPDAVPRIDISLDPSLEKNTYRIESTDFGIAFRMYSVSGFLPALDALTAYVVERGEYELKPDAILAQDSYLTGYDDVKDTASRIYFDGNTTQSPILYHVGDEIEFEFSLKADGEIIACPVLGYEVFTDDGKSYKHQESGLDGTLSFTIPASGKGFVKICCYARNRDGDLLEMVEQEPGFFGAGIDVDQIGSAYVEPDDFDAFWDDQIQKLHQIDPDLLSLDILKGPENAVALRAFVRCPDDCGVASLYITYPADADPASLKMTVGFNGYGLPDGLWNSALSLQPGIISVNVFAHGLEAGHEPEYYDVLNGYGFNDNNDTETCYFRKMLLRDLQAIRFLKAYFGTQGVKDADGNPIEGLNLWNGQILASGGSQGGFQAIAMTALDHDVTEGNFSIPWLCDNLASATESSDMASGFRPNDSPAMVYMDSVSFGKRIPADVPVSIQMGLGDYVCPPSGVFTLYNLMNCKVKMTVTQNMTHGYCGPEAASETLLKNIE